MQNVTKAPCLTGESKQKEDKKSEEEFSPLTRMLVLLHLVTCGLNEGTGQRARAARTRGRPPGPASSRPSGQPRSVGVCYLREGERRQGERQRTGLSYPALPEAPLVTPLTPPTSLATPGGVTRGCEGGWGTWRLKGAGSGGKEEGESRCTQAAHGPACPPCGSSKRLPAYPEQWLPQRHVQQAVCLGLAGAQSLLTSRWPRA